MELGADASFDLSQSGSWVVDWGSASRCERRDGDDAYEEYAVDVYEAPGAPRPEAPPGCKVYANGADEVVLKHASTGNTLVLLRVRVRRWVAVGPDGSRRRISAPVPFRDGAHRYTRHFRAQAEHLMAGYGMTVKKCARVMHTTPAIVKDINKSRLRALAGDMMPLHPSRHIAVDEFLIGHGHRYCTIVIDADTGELLYLERGKSKAQVMHFFEWVGEGFMAGVEAVSMDMNANYSAAFRERYPDIEIVYDGFHIIKWFNEQVIDSLRKAEAKKLKKCADDLRRAGDAEGAAEVDAERGMLFGARWNLLANERTLRAKDALNRELNAQAREDAERDGRDPAAVGRRREDNAEARRRLLDANASLNCAVRAREELQDALRLDDPAAMRAELERWCALYSKAGIAQLTRFAGTVARRMDGIVSRARHRISSGILEGTNTLVKNIRRQAFGLVDFDYFGLLLWEQTHRTNRRRRKTPTRPYHRSAKRNRRHVRQTIYRLDLREREAG
ncbi:MAG: ISL3 family transposase [Candidatus Ventricola sp.]